MAQVHKRTNTAEPRMTVRYSGDIGLRWVKDPVIKENKQEMPKSGVSIVGHVSL